MTNAEKIKNSVQNMTEIEMAVKLCELFDCEDCPVVTHKLVDNRTKIEKEVAQVTCVEANLYPYLKSEVKDD